MRGKTTTLAAFDSVPYGREEGVGEVVKRTIREVVEATTSRRSSDGCVFFSFSFEMEVAREDGTCEEDMQWLWLDESDKLEGEILAFAGWLMRSRFFVEESTFIIYDD